MIHEHVSWPVAILGIAAGVIVYLVLMHVEASVMVSVVAGCAVVLAFVVAAFYTVKKKRRIKGGMLVPLYPAAASAASVIGPVVGEALTSVLGSSITPAIVAGVAGYSGYTSKARARAPAQLDPPITPGGSAVEFDSADPSRFLVESDSTAVDIQRPDFGTFTVDVDPLLGGTVGIARTLEEQAVDVVSEEARVSLSDDQAYEAFEEAVVSGEIAQVIDEYTGSTEVTAMEGSNAQLAAINYLYEDTIKSENQYNENTSTLLEAVMLASILMIREKKRYEEVEGLHQELDDRDNEVEELTQRLHGVTQDLHHAREERVKEKQATLRFERRARLIKDEKDTVERQLTISEELQAEKERELEAMVTRIDTMGRNLTEAGDIIKRAKAEKSHNVETIAMLEQKVAQATEAHAIAENQFLENGKRLESTIAGLETNQAKARARIDAQTQEIGDLQASMRTARQNAEAAAEEIKSLTESKRQVEENLQGALDDHRMESEMQQETIVKVNEEFAAYREQVEKVKASLEFAGAQHSSVEETVDAAIETIKKTEDNFNDTLQRHERTIAVLRRNNLSAVFKLLRLREQAKQDEDILKLMKPQEQAPNPGEHGDMCEKVQPRNLFRERITINKSGKAETVYVMSNIIDPRFPEEGNTYGDCNADKGLVCSPVGDKNHETYAFDYGDKYNASNDLTDFDIDILRDKVLNPEFQEVARKGGGRCAYADRAFEQAREEKNKAMTALFQRSNGDPSKDQVDLFVRMVKAEEASARQSSQNKSKPKARAQTGYDPIPGKEIDYGSEDYTAYIDEFAQLKTKENASRTAKPVDLVERMSRRRMAITGEVDPEQSNALDPAHKLDSLVAKPVKRKEYDVSEPDDYIREQNAPLSKFLKKFSGYRREAKEFKQPAEGLERLRLLRKRLANSEDDDLQVAVVHIIDAGIKQKFFAYIEPFEAQLQADVERERENWLAMEEKIQRLRDEKNKISAQSMPFGERRAQIHAAAESIEAAEFEQAQVLHELKAKISRQVTFQRDVIRKYRAVQPTQQRLRRVVDQTFSAMQTLGLQADRGLLDALVENVPGRYIIIRKVTMALNEFFGKYRGAGTNSEEITEAKSEAIQRIQEILTTGDVSDRTSIITMMNEISSMVRSYEGEETLDASVEAKLGELESKYETKAKRQKERDEKEKLIAGALKPSGKPATATRQSTAAQDPKEDKPYKPDLTIIRTKKVPTPSPIDPLILSTIEGAPEDEKRRLRAMYNYVLRQKESVPSGVDAGATELPSLSETEIVELLAPLKKPGPPLAPPLPPWT